LFAAPRADRAAAAFAGRSTLLRLGPRRKASMPPRNGSADERGRFSR
jgi:hypothetical protein